MLIFSLYQFIPFEVSLLLTICHSSFDDRKKVMYIITTRLA